MKNTLYRLSFIAFLIYLVSFFGKDARSIPPDYNIGSNMVGTIKTTPNYFTTPLYVVSPGEYVSLGLYNDTAYLLSSVGKPTKVTGAPLCSQVIGSGHSGYFVDLSSNMWGFDDNTSGQLGIGNTTSQATPVKVTRDSLGNAFTNIAGVCGGMYTAGGDDYSLTVAWKTDGTLWISGYTGNGGEGNGTFGTVTSTYFVQIPFPAGTFITKAICGDNEIALDSAGNVWTWGGAGSLYVLGRGNSANYQTPGKITLIGGTRAIDIAGGQNWNYAILNTGHTDAWGGQYYSDYMAVGPEGNPQMTTSAIDITSYLNFKDTLGNAIGATQIRTNYESSYALLSDGSVRAWGGNAVGTIGNGIELNYYLYGLPPPYGSTAQPFDWDQGNHELQQIAPVNPAPGKYNFTQIFTNNALCYSVYYEDVNNQLYANGRNKDGEICNGVLPTDANAGYLQAPYPNSWDVPYLTAISVWAITTVASSSSPWCSLHPTTTPCSESGGIPNVPGPSCYAGSNQNVTGTTFNLSGSTSSSTGVYIPYTIWTQVSGPNTPTLTLPSGLNAVVTHAVNGTYLFQLKVTDANWRVDSAQVQIIVGSSPPPSSTPSLKYHLGQKQKIHG